MNNLKRDYAHKQSQLANVDNKINEVNAVRNDNISFFNKLITYFNKNYDEIIDKLSSYRKQLINEMNEIDRKLNRERDACRSGNFNVNSLLNEYQMSNVVVNADTVEFNAVTCSCLSRFSQMDMFSEKKITVVYENCKELFENNKCYVQKVIYVDMIKLAVCFFPKGNSGEFEEYTSIYLYVLHPFNNGEHIALNFKFEMLSDDGNESHYEKESEYVFNHQNKAAGWKNFCRIEDLVSSSNDKKSKFINENGDLVFNIYITIVDISSFMKSALN